MKPGFHQYRAAAPNAQGWGTSRQPLGSATGPVNRASTRVVPVEEARFENRRVDRERLGFFLGSGRIAGRFLVARLGGLRSRSGRPGDRIVCCGRGRGSVSRHFSRRSACLVRQRRHLSGEHEWQGEIFGSGLAWSARAGGDARADGSGLGNPCADRRPGGGRAALVGQRRHHGFGIVGGRSISSGGEPLAVVAVGLPCLETSRFRTRLGIVQALHPGREDAVGQVVRPGKIARGRGPRPCARSVLVSNSLLDGFSWSIRRRVASRLAHTASTVESARPLIGTS